jgi:hypothetical protein
MLSAMLRQGKGGWGGGETKAPESRAQGNFFAATGAVDGNATPAEKRRTAADMDDADGDDEENNKVRRVVGPFSAQAGLGG